MSATQRFHEVANDALVNISEQLWPGAKLCLIIYTKDKPGLDIVLTDLGIDLDEVLSTLRRKPISIDGTNTYKRDLLDTVIGALARGAQNSSPPPEGHWAQKFWDIGRQERAVADGLMAELREVKMPTAEPQTKGAEDVARRVSACLAACKGISTPVLEKGRLSKDAFQMEETRADKAEQQRDDLLADLIDAAAQLRAYEILHRAKGTEDSTAKAEVNAALAARFEATIAKAAQ